MLSLSLHTLMLCNDERPIDERALCLTRIDEQNERRRGEDSMSPSRRMIHIYCGHDVPLGDLVRNVWPRGGNIQYQKGATHVL